MKNKISNILKKVDYKLVILVGYAILTFVLIICHEPWRDEAQNYLLVRDLSIIKIIKQLKYEGHPFLWYLVLKPFAFLHIPYVVMRFIPWIITNGAAYLLVKKSKLNTLASLIIMFSPMFLFYGAMQFRSYILLTGLVVILMLIYDERFNHPVLYGLLLLGLLNTHILIVGFVIGILLIDGYELIRCKDKDSRKNIIISCLLALVGFLLVFLQFHNTLSDTNQKINIVLNMQTIKNMIFIFEEMIRCYFNNQILYVLFYVTLFASIVYCLFTRCFRNVIITICGIGFMVAFSCFVYHYASHMMSILFMIIVFFVYSFKSKNGANLFMFLLFLLLIPYSIHLVKDDIKYEYSDSKNLAVFIQKNIPKGSTIYALEQCYTSSIIAHLKKNDYVFKYVLRDTPYTYADWESYTYQKALTEFVYSDQQYDDLPYYLGIISSKYLYNEKLSNYDIIYKTDDYVLSDEAYILYKFKEQE